MHLSVWPPRQQLITKAVTTDSFVACHPCPCHNTHDHLPYSMSLLNTLPHQTCSKRHRGRRTLRPIGKCTASCLFSRLILRTQQSDREQSALHSLAWRESCLHAPLKVQHPHKVKPGIPRNTSHQVCFQASTFLSNVLDHSLDLLVLVVITIPISGSCVRHGRQVGLMSTITNRSRIPVPTTHKH